MPYQFPAFTGQVYDPVPAGFRQIAKSADTVTYYVSNAGISANDGLSPAAPIPYATAISRSRNGMDDHILLNRGEVFVGIDLTALKSGKSASAPFVLSWYGTGPRPVIQLSTTALFNDGQYWVLIAGIEFYNPKKDPQHAEFDGSTARNVQIYDDHDGVIIEDCTWRFSELLVQKTGDNPAPKNTVINRNIWVDGVYVNTSSTGQEPRPSNIYASGADGLEITENVIDGGGWHPTVPNAGANQYNHGIYLQTSCVGSKTHVKRNIFTRNSSHGVQVRCGGYVEDNFAARNALGLLIGSELGTPPPNGTPAHMTRNVVIQGWPMIRGDNACFGPDLCTGAVRGIDFYIHNPAMDWVCEDNLAHSVYLQDTDYVAKSYSLIRRGLHIDNGTQANFASWARNLEWHFNSDTQGDGVTYSDPGRTLEEYVSQYTGDAHTFESAMDLLKSRGPYEWDEDLSSPAINAWINEGFDRVIGSSPESDATYSFGSDTVGQAPASITPVSGALVIVDGTSVGLSAKAARSTATTAVTPDNVFNLDLIAPANADQVVTWRRGETAAQARDCMVLRPQAGTSSLPGVKPGYGFQTSSSNASLRIYKFTASSAVLLVTVSAVVGDYTYFRASAVTEVQNGSQVVRLKFETSVDGQAWTLRPELNVVDDTTPFLTTTGAMQYVSGFGAPNPSTAIIDDIDYSNAPPALPPMPVLPADLTLEIESGETFVTEITLLEGTASTVQLTGKDATLFNAIIVSPTKVRIEKKTPFDHENPEDL